MFNLAAFVFLVLAVFCMGFFVALVSKNLLSRDGKNFLIRFGKAVRRKSGYIAAFGAGVFLTAFFQIASDPYHYYRWTGLMDEITVGSLVLDYPEIMETGNVPEDVRAWYAKMQEEGEI